MVMPNQPPNPFQAVSDAMIQQDRAAFWKNAALYFARAGNTPEAAAIAADQLLAAFDARDVSRTKATFGLPKAQA